MARVKPRSQSVRGDLDKQDLMEAEDAGGQRSEQREHLNDRALEASTGNAGLAEKELVKRAMQRKTR